MKTRRYPFARASMASARLKPIVNCFLDVYVCIARQEYRKSERSLTRNIMHAFGLVKLFKPRQRCVSIIDRENSARVHQRVESHQRSRADSSRRLPKEKSITFLPPRSMRYLRHRDAKRKQQMGTAGRFPKGAQSLLDHLGG